MRATERGSHLGRTTRNGRSLEGSGYLDAVNDSGVQPIYKTPGKARQLRIQRALGKRKWLVLNGFSAAKK